MLSGGLQAFNDLFGRPLHQFVAQVVVVLASLTKRRSVEKDGLDRRYRSRVEMPVVGLKEPGPAEHVTRADRLDQHSAAVFDFGFQLHPSLPNQVEAIRRIAFPEDQLILFELGGHRKFGEDGKEVLLAQAFQKWMPGDELAQGSGVG